MLCRPPGFCAGHLDVADLVAVAVWLGRATDTTPSLPMVTDRALAGMVMAGCSG
jgi:hypothetical protein